MTDLMIGIGGAKGGVGKSTLATGLAAALAYTHTVLLVEASGSSRSSSSWIVRRDITTEQALDAGIRLPAISCTKLDTTARGVTPWRTLGEIAKGYDVVIVDTAGGAPELEQLLLYLDLILAPMRPTAFDAWSIDHLAGTKETAEFRRGGPVPLQLVFNHVSPHERGTAATLRVDLHKTYNLTAAKSEIGNRAIFGHVTNYGLGLEDLRQNPSLWKLLALPKGTDAAAIGELDQLLAEFNLNTIQETTKESMQKCGEVG